MAQPVDADIVSPGMPASREIPTSFGGQPLCPLCGYPVTNSPIASFKSWWASNDKESALSEERLFKRLPFYTPSWAKGSSQPSSSQSITSTLGRVELSTPKRFLNTFSILPTSTSTSASTSQPPATVLLPGYGAGIGFFFLNYASLASWVDKTRSPVFAVDWLGMGRSARVPFVVKAKRENTVARVTEAENFFIDALEEWRIKQGLEKMALIGHSLGRLPPFVCVLQEGRLNWYVWDRRLFIRCICPPIPHPSLPSHTPLASRHPPRS